MLLKRTPYVGQAFSKVRRRDEVLSVMSNVIETCLLYFLSIVQFFCFDFFFLFLVYCLLPFFAPFISVQILLKVGYVLNITQSVYIDFSYL